jgi:hypothetical protein
VEFKNQIEHDKKYLFKSYSRTSDTNGPKH